MFTKPIIIEPRASNSKNHDFWGSLPRTYDPTMYAMPAGSRFAWELVLTCATSSVLVGYAFSLLMGWV